MWAGHAGTFGPVVCNMVAGQIFGGSAFTSLVPHPNYLDSTASALHLDKYLASQPSAMEVQVRAACPSETITLPLSVFSDAFGDTAASGFLASDM